MVYAPVERNERKKKYISNTLPLFLIPFAKEKEPKPTCFLELNLLCEVWVRGCVTRETLVPRKNSADVKREEEEKGYFNYLGLDLESVWAWLEVLGS